MFIHKFSTDKMQTSTFNINIGNELFKLAIYCIKNIYGLKN